MGGRCGIGMVGTTGPPALAKGGRIGAEIGLCSTGAGACGFSATGAGAATSSTGRAGAPIVFGAGAETGATASATGCLAGSCAADFSSALARTGGAWGSGSGARRGGRASLFTCRRIMSARSSSSELECVFLSLIPSSGSRSMIRPGLTSSSLASSLIRILLILRERPPNSSG